MPVPGSGVVPMTCTVGRVIVGSPCGLEPAGGGVCVSEPADGVCAAAAVASNTRITTVTNLTDLSMVIRILLGLSSKHDVVGIDNQLVHSRQPRCVHAIFVCHVAHWWG